MGGGVGGRCAHHLVERFCWGGADGAGEVSDGLLRFGPCGVGP